jgi:hypothetical protein
MPALPPANRIVAFAGPYFSVIAGGVASWLVAKVNIAGVPGLDQHNIQTAIAGGLAWLLVAGLAWAGHSKWLTGHHIMLGADGQVTAAAAAAAATPTAAIVPAAVAPTNGSSPAGGQSDLDEIEDFATEAHDEGNLVSDEVEFASPPSPASDTPVEPEGT